MKKITSKCLALVISSLLIVFAQNNVAYANKLSDNLDNNYEILSEDKINEKKSIANNVFDFNVISDNSDMEIISSPENQIKSDAVRTSRVSIPNISIQPEDEHIEEELEERTPRTMGRSSSSLYYGTLTGYLSGTNDYALYPATLSSGDYLQVRLASPTNVQLDYDLILFDSSLTPIKTSDYATMTNVHSSLEESVGYLATTDESLYICVYASVGGSQTDAYTLDYSITTNFSEDSEPDENVKESTRLSLGTSGANTTGRLNSPIDNDWYSFEVQDNNRYDKIRLNLESSSSYNGCNIEIYRNLLSNYYGMQLIAQGTSGEIQLPAGDYYIRVVSTNDFSSFNPNDIPNYSLSVTPVSRVNGVEITTYRGYNGTVVNGYPYIYPEGIHYRIDNQNPNRITIVGWAYYEDSIGNKTAASNVLIHGEIKNRSWEQLGRNDLAYAWGSAVTGNNGFFNMTIEFNSGVGLNTYNAMMSKHYYDVVDVRVNVAGNESIMFSDLFYVLNMSPLYTN